jgi:maleate isomerase
LGLNKAIKLLGVKRLGLVTPYVDDVQAAIVKNYKGIGVDASAERHLGRTDNVKFAELGAETFYPW